MCVSCEAEEDPSVDEEAREWFRKLEAGDEEATALWQWFRDESFSGIQSVSTMNLVFSFDSYNGEAFYNDKMDEVVDIFDRERTSPRNLKVPKWLTLKKYGIEHPALIKKIRWCNTLHHT